MYIARWGINIFKCQIKIRKSLSREGALVLDGLLDERRLFFRTAMSRFYGIGNDVYCRSTDGRPDVRLNDCEDILSTSVDNPNPNPNLMYPRGKCYLLNHFVQKTSPN